MESNVQHLQRSPHFSPDRITRHASSRQADADADMEIVSRIPQPYRTSLSAVTPPLRVPKSLNSEQKRIVSPACINLLGGYRRTTSPGRIKPRMPVDSVLPSSNAENELPSYQIVGISDLNSETTRPESDCSKIRCIEDYSSLASKCDNNGAIDQREQFLGNFDEKENTAEVDIKKTHHSNKEAIEVLDCIASNKDGLRTEHNNVPTTANVPTTSNGHSKFFGRFMSLRIKKRDVRGPVSASVSNGVKINSNTSSDECLPPLPSTIHASRERSRTLPSRAMTLTSPRESKKVPKSRSSSITSFFRRMSPKVLRRSMTGSSEKRSEAENGPDMDTLKVDTAKDTRISPSHSHKSPKLSPMKRFFTKSKSKDADHTPDNCDKMKSAQLLVEHETSELLNIKTNSPGSSKDKNRRNDNDVPGIQSYAFSVVEFPDDMINSTNDVVLDSRLSLSFPRILDEVGTKSCTYDFTSENKQFTQIPLNCSLAGATRKHQPPSSLNVRPVHKFDKKIFQFPAHSMESIGQCSLDIAETGSEASLVKNGPHMSVSTSKRTLTSQENITSACVSDKTSQSTDQTSVNGVLPSETIPADNSSNCVPTSVKSPPYIGISRLIGGYPPYKNYNSSSEQSRMGQGSNLNNSTSNANHMTNTCVVLQNGHPTVRTQHPDCVYGSINAPSYTPSYMQTNKDVDASESRNFLSSNNHAILQSNDHAILQSRELIGSELLVAVDDEIAGDYSNSSGIVVSNQSDSGVCRERQECSAGNLNGTEVQRCIARASAIYSQNLEELERSIADHVSIQNSTPQKDGHYFMSLVNQEYDRLKLLCGVADRDLAEVSMSEEVEGRVRAAVGKATLLTDKKFKQFKELCRNNLLIDSEEGVAMTTTSDDLAGFWDLVGIQIEDVDRQFVQIDQLRQSGWKEDLIRTPTPTPIESKTTNCSNSSGSKSTKGFKARSTAVATPKSSKSREEARQRLMAAKLAGRQRKASESDKDVEIFVT